MRNNLTFKIVLSLSALFFLVATPSYAGKSKLENITYPELNKFELPEIQKGSTGNGIQLRLIKNDKLPLIELNILLKGGDVYDPADKIGLATVTARMLRIGGAGDLTPDKLDQLLDAQGISIAVSGQTNSFSISMSCLLENFDQGMGILSKMLLSPRFDREKLEETKSRMKSGISRRNDDPDSINTREFDKLIYGEKSPFAAELEYEHVDNITIEDIQGVYYNFFTPGNMLAGVSGPIDIEQVRELFERHLGNWQRQGVIPPYPVVEEPKRDFKVAFAEKSNLNQSYLTIGKLGLIEKGMAPIEKAKIMIFNSIFSQGFASRLMNRVRVKMGLTYGIGGGIGTGHLFPGTISFSTNTKSVSTLEAIKAIFDEIHIIRKEKVSEKELKDARDYFLNSYVFKFSSPEKILQKALSNEFYGISAEYEEQLTASLKEVSADDVLQVAQKYMDPEQMIVFVVGKEAGMEGALSELGTVKKIDISITPPAVKETIPEATAETLKKGDEWITRLVKGKYKGYKTIKTLFISADSSISMQGRTIPMAVTTTMAYPGKIHSEITVFGMKILSIINGDKGKMIQGGQEKPLSSEDVAKNRFGNLYHIFNNKDIYNIQYLKEAQVEGKKYHVLYVFDKTKNWVKLFVNQETELIEIEEKVSNIPGQSGIAREIKSGFLTIGGIPFAHKRETFVGDKLVSTTIVNLIKVDTPVDNSLFKL